MTNNRAIFLTCLVLMLLNSACAMRIPESAVTPSTSEHGVYKEVVLPSEAGDGLQLRLLWTGVEGEEDLDCIDIAYENKVCRVMLVPTGSVLVAIAADKKVVFDLAFVPTRVLKEESGVVGEIFTGDDYWLGISPENKSSPSRQAAR